jgi:hypothetical protein
MEIASFSQSPMAFISMHTFVQIGKKTKANDDNYTCKSCQSYPALADGGVIIDCFDIDRREDLESNSTLWQGSIIFSLAESKRT